MVIEDVFYAKQLERQRHQENEVGRIAALNDINALFEVDFPCQHGFPEQRRAVFEQKSERPARFERQGMAMDFHAINDFVALLKPFALRADRRGPSGRSAG